MCGIAGAVWTNAKSSVSLETLDRMTDELKHRGPDDRGTHIRVEHDSGVALGHRRLSIIDLSPTGRQPLCNENETVWVVLNGEIYNFEELRKNLIEKGHNFRGTSDTEVLVHLYEEHGLGFVQHLNGMFAIALWDSDSKKLVLVRDRFGKKPLIYKHETNRVAFASELKSLLRIPDIETEIDPGAIDLYLTYQYVPHPKTIYRGISKLPPGHLAVFDAIKNEFSVHRYWNFDLNIETTSKSFTDWSDELRELLDSAVKLRLRSDVPLGSFLSGGIDSTIITGLMQKLSPQKVRTFSIGFPHKEYDETSFARIAAEKFGTEHEEFIVTPNLLEILPKLTYHYDEPFSDSSMIPTWYLSQLTRKHVTVALCGDAGDELFAGYQRYQAVRFGNYADVLPMFLRKFLAEPFMRMIPSSTRQKSLPRRLKRFLEALAMQEMERYLQWIAIFNRSRKTELYSTEFAKQLSRLNNETNSDMLDFLTEAASRSKLRDAVTKVSLTDFQTYLPCDLMTKVDIASMGNALECRSPFLDYRVAEHAIRMPINHKIHGKTGKYILRETFRELFPAKLLKRGKMGFGVPLDHWFRGELANYVREILLDRQTLGRGYFNPNYVTRIVNEHINGIFDHAGRIWSLLFLELWFRRWK